MAHDSAQADLIHDNPKSQLCNVETHCGFVLSFSCTRMQTHTHMCTHTHAPLPCSSTHTHTHTCAFSTFLVHTHTHTNKLASKTTRIKIFPWFEHFKFARSLSRTLSWFSYEYLIPPLMPKRSFGKARSLSHTHIISLSFFLSLSLSHTHTYTQSLSLSFLSVRWSALPSETWSQRRFIGCGSKSWLPKLSTTPQRSDDIDTDATFKSTTVIGQDGER